MSLTSEKAIQEFLVWAKENEDQSVFPKIQKEEISYYSNRNLDDAYLKKYAFENMAGLKKALEVYGELKDSQLLLQLIVKVCESRNNFEVEPREDKDSLLQKERLFIEKPIKAFVKADRNLENEKVIEEIRAWAEENSDNAAFTEISKGEESYYSDRYSEETYLMEYSFQDMIWLKEALEKYSGVSGDLQILKGVIVEICRSRYINELKTCASEDNRKDKVEEKNLQEDRMELPQYIYVF